MGLRILTGRAGSGKTSQVIREIGERLGGGPLLLLVPEQYTLQAELELTQRLRLDAFWDLEVLSPSRLVERVRGEVGGAARVVLDEAGRGMALRRAMLELSGQLAYYRRGGPGFIEQLARLLTELKRNEVEDTALHWAADALPDGLLRSKLYDLAALYASYEAQLAGHYLDGEDAVDLFVQNAPHSAFLRAAQVWVDGFDVIPPKTCRLLSALAQACRQVTVTFQMDNRDGRDAALFDQTRLSYENLARMVREAGVEWERVRLPGHPLRQPELGHLERELYAVFPTAWPDAPHNVHLVAAHTPQAEAERAAGFLFEQNRRKGWRWGECAVICADMGRYGGAVEAALRRRGIPAYVDEPACCAGHPAARYLLSGMEGALRGLRQEDVLRCLKSGYAPLTESEQMRLEIDICAHDLRGRRWKLPAADGRIERVRQAFFGPLEAFATAASGTRPAKELAGAVWELMRASQLSHRLMQNMKRHSVKGELTPAQHCNQVWDAMVKVLDQAVELCGDTPMTGMEFVQMLRAGLESASLGAIPAQADAVYVGELARFKPRGLRALYVLGVNDGLLPRSEAPLDLLAEEEREQLRWASKQADREIVLPDLQAHQAVERFTIYTALTSPAESLTLSYALSEQDGKALRPSPLIARLQRLFPAAPTECGLAGDWALYAGSPDALAEQAAYGLRQAMKEGRLDGETGRRLSVLRQGAPEHFARVLRAVGFDGAAPPLPAPLAHALYGEEATSISRLERFAHCPFQHFVLYGLQPHRQPQPLMDPMATGTLYHEAMERFIRAIQESGVRFSQITAEHSDTLMDVALLPLAQEAEKKVTPGGRTRAHFSQMRATLHRAGRILTHQLSSSRFLPIKEEAAFGQEGRPPLLLDLGGGQRLKVIGRIDRVDLYDDGQRRYLRVIDYKSGNVTLDLADVYYGLRLQLFVYLEAVLDQEQAQPAGVFYFRIADPAVTVGEGEDVEAALQKELRLRGLVLSDTRLIQAMCGEAPANTVLPVALTKAGEINRANLGSVLTEEQFSLLRRYTRAKLKELAGRMLEGEVAVSPVARKDGNIPCPYCEYPGICGIDPSLPGCAPRRIEIAKEDALRKMQEEE